MLEYIISGDNMKKLRDYEILNKQVFYRGWHILEYIDAYKNLSSLDMEAIKATIMDALVTSGSIDPKLEYLDFKNLSIVQNKTDDTYSYEKYPNISGIPLWMKEKFRTKCCYVTGGIPVSVYLSIPSCNRCVYDMNMAVSALFEDCTFYRVNYYSPTRLGEIATERPFIEVDMDGIPYLIDNLTRRIIKRSFFERNYGFDIEYAFTKKSLEGKKKEYYETETSDFINMLPYLSFQFWFKGDLRKNAEHVFEIEESKKYFKDAWEEYEQEIKESEKLFIK